MAYDIQGQDSGQARSWHEPACAKINLGLRVLGRRLDGFHELVTLMQTIDLQDELHAEPAPRTRLTSSSREVPADSSNLVHRAVELFAAEVTPVRPLDIHLVKRIPVSAGLGGGSADAAAALRLLNRAHGSPCSTGELRRLAARLGSDVPFLIQGGAAVARGRGERLTPVRWTTRYHYLLVWPGVSVSTRWAYGKLQRVLTPRDSYSRLLFSIPSGGCVDHGYLLSCLENDFLPVVERVYPIVADLIARLEACGARTASMTGSGSTVFGIFDDRNAAVAALEALEPQGCRSFLCHAVTSCVEGCGGAGRL